MKLWSKLFAACGIVAAVFAVQGAAIAADEGDAVAGKSVFNANCKACHALVDAKAKGASDLDKAKPSYQDTLNAVITPPSGMPPNTLSDVDRKNVAAYVTVAIKRGAALKKCKKIKDKKKKKKCEKKAKAIK